MALSLLGGGTSALADEANLSATADTYFDWANSTTAYGAEKTLKCGIWQEYWNNATPGLKGSTSNIAVLKFDVSAYKGKITSATLKVTATNPNTKARSIYLGYFTETGWTESTTAATSGMNTRSATALNIHPFSLSQSIANGATTEVSFSNSGLVDYLNNDEDGIVSLIVYGVGQECTINSKEADTGNPKLVLNYTNETLYNYSIKAVSGGTIIKEFVSNKNATGVSFSTYLPKVIFYNGTYYMLDDAGVTNFFASYVVGDADTNIEINYTPRSNIAAFWEGESMSHVGHSVFNNRSDIAEASNGGAITPYSGTANGIKTNTTIGKGAYNITVAPNRWADQATEYKLQYSTDSENWIDIETVSFAATSNDAYVADNVVIPGNSYLRLMSPGSTPRHSIDYILVEKLADIIDANNEFVGAFDMTTNRAESSRFSLKKGETKVFTFQNHGQDFGKNWKINVIEGSVWKSITRADSWDEMTTAATKVAYQVSKDGGNTKVNLDWAEYQADMADANVVATLSYGLDGTLSITTASTGAANGYIYYVDQDVTGLTQDLEISLSINYSWLEILSVESTAVPVTFGTTKYATFASPYALELRTTASLKAYKAAVVGTTVRFTELDQTVPANTGVLLEGTVGETISIPVVASGDAVSENAFEVNTAGTTFAAEDGYTYYGLMKNSNPLTFATFNPATVAIPANKAYLKVANVGGVHALNVLFDDTTDGIQSVDKAQHTDGNYYDLSGRRVMTPTKGIYVKAGKMVVVK